jgi:hypothetical protein
MTRTIPTYDETPYQRVAREQHERQAKREAALKASRRKSIPGGRYRSGAHKPKHEETYEDRLDDLGLSNDY